MLAKRLIPMLILEHGITVESHQFSLSNAIHSSAAGSLRAMGSDYADEIIVLDVSRNTQRRELFYSAFSDIGDMARCPITAGGWVDGVEEASRLFGLGADKVTVNTLLRTHPKRVERIVERYGSQAVVASIDIKRGMWMVDRGRREAGDVIDAINAAQDCGVGEILLTDILYEGGSKGYNMGLVREVAEQITIPLLVFGGVARMEHLLAGLSMCDGVCAGNLCHYSENSVKAMKSWLKKRGANVR